MRKADDLPPTQCRTSIKSGVVAYPEPLGPPWPVLGDLHLYHVIITKCRLFKRSSVGDLQQNKDPNH